MKTLVLVLALMVLGAGAAIAEPVAFDVYQGWNLIALPQAPFDPAVPSVFGAVPTVDVLSTFDPIGGSDFPYNLDTAEFFGGIMLGQGYWLWCDSEQLTVAFEGFPNGLPDTVGGARTDMWISLPGSDPDGDGVTDIGGWHLVGNPYNHLVAVGVDGANIKFTDGNEVKTWAEACSGADPWVGDTMTGFIGGSDVPTGYTEDKLNFLIPAAGYWMWTNKPNLAMIIDANQEFIIE